LSHASGVHPYAGPVKVREPVARPLDVVAVELLLSASQAFLVGVVMYLAVGIWDDRGVGLGSVAAILVLLALVVGGAWLYWLLGGIGWPMAAANTPVALFLGSSLVLGWFGEDLIRVPGAPLLLAVAAAIYGIIAGVFLDSPRRWRWDQRQSLRPGTQVPRVSLTTHALVAQVPRSLPRRVSKEPNSDLAARIEQSTPPGTEPSGSVGIPYVDGSETPGAESDAPRSESKQAASEPTGSGDDGLSEAPDVTGTEISASGLGKATMPTERLGGSARPSDAMTADADSEESGSIELPTSIEPRAQRSPWAWAAPPDWNRDEDDDTAGSSSKRS
jgi:hypothetical protein